MRPRIYVSILILLTLISIIYRLVAFVQIFYEHAGIAITQDEILAAHTQHVPDPRPELIPRIIHQVFHDWRNSSMPADWDEARNTCISNNSDWKYYLWTAESSREFIAKEYPQFLTTYDGYKFPVQRVDTVRYFLLLHYGGIYLDLDNGCLQSLEPLLYYPTWTTDGGRGALSNNILASRPHHPFWTLLTNSLIPYNYNYFFPYVTISYASGQWFETDVWQRYHASLPKAIKPGEDHRLHRIMMDDRPGTAPWIFFTKMRGGTWENWDNAFFLWIGDHLLLEGCVILGLVGLIWWSTLRCLQARKARPNKEEYSRIKRDDEDV